MSSEDDSSADGEPAIFSIGEVAERTGMTVAGLRNWEARYGVPAPQRSARGQRRYRESDCRLIAEIIRRRDSGVALGVAVDQARRAAGSEQESSIYAALRRLHPELAVHRMDKKMLLALTWAVEDQCCAAASGPLLIGAFQKTRFYESARRRWENMATTGYYTIAFADFDRPRTLDARISEVPIASASPLHREWALVCDSTELPAFVLGWEPPGQDDCPDASRLFEVVWSVDPQLVRQAASVGVGVAARSVPELPVELGDRLAEAAPPASADLRRASGLLERALDYIARR